MKGILFCLFAALIVAEIAAYTIVTLPGTLIFTPQPSPPKFTWKYSYYENGWNTTGWIQFVSDPKPTVVPLWIGHGNYYDVDLYLNQYCKPYFYSRGYMCFGPTLTHSVGCPSLAYGLTNEDCADSPENMHRATKSVDILFSTQFQSEFGNILEYDSFVGFGHSYGAFLMGAFAPVESRFTSVVTMSGGKKTYGTQFTDAYYAQTAMPVLQLHGQNDTAVSPSADDDMTVIYQKGGVETFYLLFKDQAHAWVISTVGGVMHDWFRTYDPRNNSAAIPVITGISFSSGIVTLTGRGFGSNSNGLSSVMKNDALPYSVATGPYTWSNTQISFAAASVSSAYIVAKADSASLATSQVVDRFGGVFSAQDLPGPVAPVANPVAPVSAPLAAPVAAPMDTVPLSSPVADSPVSSPVDSTIPNSAPTTDVPYVIETPSMDVPVASTPLSSGSNGPASTPATTPAESIGSGSTSKLDSFVILVSIVMLVLSIV